MLNPDKPLKMNNRGGLPVKNIVTAIFILLSVYLVYIYNTAQNRLHDAEMTGSRYRREAEEKANEIQGLIAARDELQERNEAEKHELSNRLKSANQKHSMLQSQNTEIEADFTKLKQDMDNLRSDHTQAENQHAQEYQILKQAKDNEIQSLQDQLAVMKSQNDELQNTVIALQAQVQAHENEKKNLLDQNAQLQLLQFQQQKQLELQKQHEENAKKAQDLQNVQRQINVVSEHASNEQKQSVLSQGNQNVNLMSQQDKQPADSAANKDDLVLDAANGKHEMDQAGKIDELNSLNQAKPPNVNGNQLLESNLPNEEKKEDQRPDVNPNDLQKAQILEPLKQDGGEADRDAQMNVRMVEEQREKEELEHQAIDHKNPLDLGQMEQPLELSRNSNENHIINGGQQQAPVVVEEDKKDAALDDGQKENKAINPVAPL